MRQRLLFCSLPQVSTPPPQTPWGLQLGVTAMQGWERGRELERGWELERGLRARRGVF